MTRACRALVAWKVPCRDRESMWPTWMPLSGKKRLPGMVEKSTSQWAGRRGSRPRLRMRRNSWASWAVKPSACSSACCCSSSASRISEYSSSPAVSSPRSPSSAPASAPPVAGLSAPTATSSVLVTEDMAVASRVARCCC